MTASALKYKDENDKSLGIAGMAISLVFNDKEHLLASVSVEDGEEALCLAEEFFFFGNPRLSAKIAWKETLKQAQVAAGLLLGNVMCRSFAVGSLPDPLLMDAVHQMIVNDSIALCSLENDEAEALYGNASDYYRRLFSHPGVCGVARDFAANLISQRRMSAGEVIDNLRRLSNL